MQQFLFSEVPTPLPVNDKDSHSKMDPSTRKRPLLVSTNKPRQPITNTTRMLEKILDGEKTKKRRKSNVSRQLATTTLSTQTNSGRISSMRPTFLVDKKDNPFKSNVLEHRGGLENVPTTLTSAASRILPLTTKQPTKHAKLQRRGLVKEYSTATKKTVEDIHKTEQSSLVASIPTTSVSARNPPAVEEPRPEPTSQSKMPEKTPGDFPKSSLSLSLSVKKSRSNRSEGNERRRPVLEPTVPEPPRAPDSNVSDHPATSVLPTPPQLSQKSIAFATDTKVVTPNISQPMISSNDTKPTRAKPLSNDNFVRLNLRNSAGACRGARNKKMRNKFKRSFKCSSDANPRQDGGDDDALPSQTSTIELSQGQSFNSRQTGVDPVDDYLDGAFKSNPQKSKKASSSPVESSHTNVPVCARHSRPCKLVEVKKNTRGNKGRKFYACSMPRGEQCDHFEWMEDTKHAICQVLSGNSSYSSFIARQVAAHVDRFRVLTVPELRQQAMRYNLGHTGKKSQLLMRLAIWARDQLVQSCPDSESGGEELVDKVPPAIDEEMSNDSDDDSESSEELELWESNTDDMSDGAQDESVHNEVHDVPDDDADVNVKISRTLRSVFGHSLFREGQEWAIKRCLEEKRSLLVAPTGFGKSLCYALPASLLPGICVVVSPLISLIQDQLRALPPRIPAATLSGTSSTSAAAAILDDVIRNRIKILFVSPERLASPSFRRLFNETWDAESQQHVRRFPEISLLCIDEAHCVSQWAHNFRPCFLRFQTLLSHMKPKGILAVTATAGPHVMRDICQTIGVPNSSITDENEHILVIDKPRDNISVLCQYVNDDEERLTMLSKILKPGSRNDQSDPTKGFKAGTLADGSVIVYVWRQRDCEVVAENLVNSGVVGGVVIYHGGMDASAREKAQSKFMRGKARICVATVAFGMGIDKADVVGVVHMYLSSSPEHFIQEIGRAGRDGRQALAISLPSKEEIPIRHSLVHSNFVSKVQIQSLLQAVRDLTVKASKGMIRPLCIALPLEELVTTCDCKSETLETMLSMIEQRGADNAFLQVHGYGYDRATIAMKKCTLQKLAEFEQVATCIAKVGKCCDPPLGGDDGAMEPEQKRPRTFDRHFLAYSEGSYNFSVADCANELGVSAEPRHVFAALRRMQSNGSLELALDTTASGRAILIRLSEQGTAFFSSPDFDEHCKELSEDLFTSFTASVLSGSKKVLEINHILTSIWKKAANPEDDDLPKFHQQVNEYFQGGSSCSLEEAEAHLQSEPFQIPRQIDLENDLYSLVRDLPLLQQRTPTSPDAPRFGDPVYADYTSVAAAKFLHGLDSPRFPMRMFRSHPLFGKWKRCPFPTVVESIGKMLKSNDL